MACDPSTIQFQFYPSCYREEGEFLQHPIPSVGCVHVKHYLSMQTVVVVLKGWRLVNGADRSDGRSIISPCTGHRRCARHPPECRHNRQQACSSETDANTGATWAASFQMSAQPQRSAIPVPRAARRRTCSMETDLVDTNDF